MNYARYPDMLPDLNAQGSTSDQVQVLGALGEASQALITGTGGRRFHSTIETRYYDGDGLGRLWVGDLLSITSLKFDDGTAAFADTLAATDYYFWPSNAAGKIEPYRRIDINPNGDYSAFPNGRERIELVGKFGYSEIKQAVIGAAAVTATVASTTGLTITASADVSALVYPGDSVFIGTEELGDVTSVAGNGLTFVVAQRGRNGTTAATHSSAALSLRRYPADVERAVRADAARYLWRASQGYPEGGFREMWPAIAMTMHSYQDAAAVI